MSRLKNPTTKKNSKKKQLTTSEKIRQVDSSIKGTFLTAFLFIVLFAGVGVIQMISPSYAAEQPVESLPAQLTSKTEMVSGIYPEQPARVAYIDGISLVKRFYGVDNSGKAYDIYCLERWLVQMPNQTYKKSQEAMADKGMAYLLSQIYPNNDNFLAGQTADVKRYISQLTIWYYQDRKAGYADDQDICSVPEYASNDCKKAGSDAEADTTFYWSNSLRASEKTLIKNSQYWTTINQIVTDALAYREESHSINVNKDAIQYSLSEDGKYYESSLIPVQMNGSNYTGYQINSSTSNITFYNEQGVEIKQNTRIEVGQGFKFKIPKEAVKEKGSINVQIQISGTYTTRDAYMYIPDDSDNQKALIGVMQLNPSQAVLNLSIEEQTGSARISKTDATTGEELAGAHLLITDAYGKEVDSWVSTNEPHYIENIKDGTYTLTETIAPEGYATSTSSIEFTVEAGKTTEVEMQNVPNIDVPDTASTIPVYIYIVGAMAFLIGVGLIIIALKQPRHE